jgi:hypothetical protein
MDAIKASKFRTLAEKRMTRTLADIGRVGNLSSRRAYDYVPEEVAKMFTALRSAVDDAERKFMSDEPQFRF